MKSADLLIAVNTVWVVVAAVLVLFMQAGFAFLEAGLTRMKNAAHIAGKQVLSLGVAAFVYWAVGFGLAFGDGNKLIGTHGFFPSVGAMLAVGKAPFSFFTTIPGAAGYLFEVVFAAVSLAVAWGAMAERAKLWSTSPSASSSPASTRSSRTGSGRAAAGCSREACRTSPARPSSTTRARWRRSRGRFCSGRGSASSATTAARMRSPATTSPTPFSAR